MKSFLHCLREHPCFDGFCGGGGGGGGLHCLPQSVRMFSLPPANEVWGKVIFSQACVKNSVHGGGACSRGVPALGGVLPGGLLRGAAPRGYLVLVRGAWWSPPSPPAPTATAAGGTHPTEMHSCSHIFFLKNWPNYRLRSLYTL